MNIDHMKHHLLKIIITYSSLLLIGIFFFVPQALALTVSGTTLNQNGSRFIVEGANLEFYRDSGCSFITTGQWAVRTQIIAKMKSLGINAIRFNYEASWLGQSSTNLTQFLDFMQLAAQNGMFVMPSDHSFTGLDLVGYNTTSFPLFQSIITGVRSRGFENYLIMNPYNEPYGNTPGNNWDNWLIANKATLDYLRTTLNFKGIIVLDTRSWASSFDANYEGQAKTYDATLLGGTANVVFSNHWYPNHDYTTRVKPTFDAATTLPELIGELGQINPGVTNVVASYPISILDNVVSYALPRGHNGVFCWMWNWCDENSMTNGDYVTLNTYGQIYPTHYYNLVNGTTSSPLPTPSASSVASPRPSPAASAYPSPSAQASIVASATPGVGGLLYRGINFNGNSVVIDGNQWDGKTAANYTTNGSWTSDNQTLTLSPAVADSDKASMIRSSINHASSDTNGNFVGDSSVTLTSVPNGTYDVSLYTVAYDLSKTFSVNLEGQLVAANVTVLPGGWKKLGPWRTTVNDGTLQITSSGEMAYFSGIEVMQPATASPVASPSREDVNGDGVVNELDLESVLKKYGQTGAGIREDINLDANVNSFDVSIVAAKINRPSSLPSASTISVASASPLPTATPLLASTSPLPSGTVTNFLKTSGFNLTYNNQTVQLKGANVNNLQALRARWGPAGDWIWSSNSNINDIYMTEADYQKMAALGGNHFRFGLSFSWWRDTRTQFYQMLDQQVAWAKQYHVWLVPVLFTTPADCYEGYTQYCTIWSSSTEQQQLINFWVDIATRYKNEPIIAAFDLLNEPTPTAAVNYSSGWFNFAQRIMDAIYQVDPNHLIIVESTSDPYFTKFARNNVIYSVHDYIPYPLSHCDATSSSYSWPGSVPYNGRTIYWNYNSLIGSGTNDANIAEVYKINWAISNNVPYHVGEFGPSGNCYNSYISFINDHMSAYNYFKISHSFFVWRGGQNYWGIYPDTGTLVPYDINKENAVKTGWTGAIRP
jgi:hypothetical protein